MKIKGAIFDMDGTLVDSLSFWPFMWREVGKKYFGVENFSPDVEVDKKVRTMIYDEAMAWFKELYKIPGDTDAFVKFTLDGCNFAYRRNGFISESSICLSPKKFVFITN